MFKKSVALSFSKIMVAVPFWLCSSYSLGAVRQSERDDNRCIHIRPITDTISTLNPLEVIDTVSVDFISNLYPTVVELDRRGQPTFPWVDKLDVSKKGKVYTLKLKSRKDSKGEPITHRYISTHLNTLLDTKVASDLLTGVKSIQESSDTIEIVLDKPDPLFLNKLGHYRVSLFDSTNRRSFGPYLLSSEQNKAKQWTLNYCSNCEIEEYDRTFPRTIKYQIMTEDEAINAFNKGEVHDLLHYDISPEKVSKLNSQKVVHSNYRTYSLFLNAKALPKETRRKLKRAIQARDFAERCLPNDSKAHSIMPPGAFGSTTNTTKAENRKKDTASEKPFDQIEIYVPNSLKNEKCFYNIASTIKGLTVKKADYSDLIPLWKEGKISGLFGYLEVQQSAVFASFFQAGADFSLGKTSDPKLDTLMSLKENAGTIEEQRDTISLIVKHIDTLDTAIPIAHARATAFISNRYQEDSFGVSTPFRLPVNRWKYKEKCVE